MVEKLISVSEFSRFPGGRWKKDGPFSGEEFRDTIVIPALKAAKAAGDKVVVSLDDVEGYASSFLEETFGGIVRANVMPPEELMGILSVRSADPVFSGFKADALRYLERAIKSQKAA